eukprot:182097-Chlamydomonas_euryale.AAC.4
MRARKGQLGQQGTAGPARDSWASKGQLGQQGTAGPARDSWVSSAQLAVTVLTCAVSQRDTLQTRRAGQTVQQCGSSAGSVAAAARRPHRPPPPFARRAGERQNSNAAVQLRLARGRAAVQQCGTAWREAEQRYSSTAAPAASYANKHPWAHFLWAPALRSGPAWTHVLSLLQQVLWAHVRAGHPWLRQMSGERNACLSGTGRCAAGKQSSGCD